MMVFLAGYYFANYSIGHNLKCLSVEASTYLVT